MGQGGFGILGSEKRAPGPFEDTRRHFGRVGVLSVSVKGAMECHMRVNDVFCASAAKRHSKHLGDLLHARALSCHLLDGEKILRGKDHSRCEMTCKHLG